MQGWTVMIQHVPPATAEISIDGHTCACADVHGMDRPGSKACPAELL
jgi:hypothetical protein